MIGISGSIYLGDGAIKDDHKVSEFVEKFKFKFKNLKRKNISLTIVDNDLDKSIYFEQNNICVVIGDIYEEQFVSSNKKKAKYIYDFFKNYGYKKINNINGSFAFLIITDCKKVFLGVDNNSFIPLFYSFKNNKLIFSFDISNVAENSEFTRDLNYYNFSSILLTGGIGLDNQTKLKNIYKLSAGEAIKVENKKLVLNQPDSFNYKNANKTNNSHLEDVADELNKSIRRRVASNDNIGIGLSGGLDSRILIGALHNNKDINILSYNYGRKYFIEKKIARKIASKLGIYHCDYVIPDTIYLKYLKDVIYYSSGESSITLAPQMHIHNSFKEKNNITKMMFGSFFDYTGGDHGISNDLLKINKFDDLISFYKNGYILKQSKESFSKYFKDKNIGYKYYDYVFSTMENNLKKIKGNNFADINTSFFFHNRGKNWYNKHLSLSLLSNKLSIPFYDREFLKQLSCVPVEYRMNDVFRVDLLKFINSEISSIIYDATMAPASTSYPENKKLKEITEKETQNRHRLWLKFNMSDKYKSNRNDANFLEWFTKMNSYQNFLIRTLLDKKKSILINSIFSFEKIKKIIDYQIDGKKNNLRDILMLLNLEISSQIFLNNIKPDNNNFVNFDKFIR